MKSILALAVIAAAFAGATAALAQDRAGGHWEWRTSPSFGPKVTVPAYTRAWVRDSETRMAFCDGTMMEDRAANYMVSMLGSASRPAG